MKLGRIVFAVILALAIAAPAMAAKKAASTNAVNVTGDIAKDGHLMIDVNWAVDMAKYPGMSRDDIRKKVRDDIWNVVLAKIEDATKRLNLSYEKSNFIMLKEYHDVLERWPDNSKLYSLKLQVEFIAEQEPPPPAPKKDKGFVLQQRWNNEI